MNLEFVANEWLVGLNNVNLVGVIAVPKEYPKIPIQVNLRKLNLKTQPNRKTKINPKEIPALRIYIHNFQYNALNLGAIRANINPVNLGITIDNLFLQTENLDLEGKGYWYVQGQGQRSALKGFVNSKNVGETLKSLGITDNLENGIGHASYALQWRGPFTHPNIRSVTVPQFIESEYLSQTVEF